MKSMLLLTFGLLIQSTFAEKHSLVLGGGCHNSLRNEMAKEANNFNSQMSSRGWKTDNIFGDENNNADIQSPNNTIFNKENLIDHLKNSADSLQKGDQFLINIISHGLPAKGEGHFICLGNGEKYNINDPEIHEQLKRIKDKKVEMAFIDNSCFGGESLELFDDYGCTISSQVSNLVSWSNNSESSNFRFGISSTLSNLLYNSSGEEITMEDLFIEGLVNYVDKEETDLLVFPQMSGDRDGQLLAEKGALYSYLVNENYSSFDEYTFMQEREAISVGEKSNEEELIRKYQCMKQATDREMEEFLSSNEKIRMGLFFGRRKEKYKKQFTTSDYNQLKESALETYQKLEEIQLFIDKDEEKIERINNQLRGIHHRIDKKLENIKVPFELGQKLSSDELEQLKLIGCEQKQITSINCPFSLDEEAFLELQGFYEGGNYFYAQLDRRASLIILDKLNEKRVSATTVMEKYEKPLAKTYWENVEGSTESLEAQNLLLEKMKIRITKQLRIKDRKKTTDQFKSDFNKIRGIKYLGNTKFLPSKKEKDCRKFKF